jgi:uncharacterized protein (TIGR00375 family)
MEINFDEVMFADLHIHSRFSRACSRNINFENLVKWARIKGLSLLGTGDFTHPVWFSEIKSLKPNGKGIYFYEDDKGNFPFVISGEISLIYSQETKLSLVQEFSPALPQTLSASAENSLNQSYQKGRKGRRVHLVILVPSVEVAEKINYYLDSKGRRDYDGRPIFNLSCEEFTREMMRISTEIEIIPAHIWTPWFGVFGSNSGFDSLKEAFGSQFENIHAIETGMSSDPAMNWRIKELEKKSIVSFSDAHSFWPFRLGREATIFRKTDSYSDLIKQIRENSFIGTIETDPAYGKYHWDGHRNCNFSCSPEKTKELNGICPVCRKPLIIGVENRVDFLADENSNHKIRKEYYKILPLHEILALFLETTIESKKVWEFYNNLISLFDNEFNILLKVNREEFLKKDIDSKVIALILKNRAGRIHVKPGYDGEYGVAQIGEAQGSLERFF